jgi:hypothetical protein
VPSFSILFHSRETVPGPSLSIALGLHSNDCIQDRL